MKNISADKVGEAIEKDLLDFHHKITIESFNRIVDYAPSESGKLKGSINAGVNEEVVEFGTEDPSGDFTKMRNEFIIKESKVGDTVNIIVGAPYGRLIEEGSSSQSPLGFLKRVGLEIQSIIGIAKS